MIKIFFLECKWDQKAKCNSNFISVIDFFESSNQEHWKGMMKLVPRPSPVDGKLGEGLGTRLDAIKSFGKE